MLVGRTAGAAGAAFAVVGLIASPQLFFDVSLAYAVSWSLLFVALAGLLVTNERPRWLAAGCALAAGALARQEVFVLIGVVLLLLGVWMLARLVDDRPAPGPCTAGLAISLVAIPLAGLHDWLLTSDPLYFLAVPVIGAEGRDVASGGVALRRLLGEVAGQPVLAALAVVGVLLLVRRGAWALLVGVTALAWDGGVLPVDLQPALARWAGTSRHSISRSSSRRPSPWASACARVWRG